MVSHISLRQTTASWKGHNKSGMLQSGHQHPVGCPILHVTNCLCCPTIHRHAATALTPRSLFLSSVGIQPTLALSPHLPQLWQGSPAETDAGGSRVQQLRLEEQILQATGLPE